MNIIRPALRILIATGSAASFLGGWAVLSHSPKPAPYTLNAAISPSSSSESSSQFVMPTLAPIPTLDPNGGSGSTSGLQAIPNLQQPANGFRPMFRTGGS